MATYYDIPTSKGKFKRRWGIPIGAVVVCAVGLVLLVAVVRQSPEPNIAQKANDPKLNLLQIGLDQTGSTVDSHSEDHIFVSTNDWTMSISPIAARNIPSLKASLRSVVSNKGRADAFPLNNRTIFRYLRGIQRPSHAQQGDYLWEFNGLWMAASVFPRNPEGLFDQRSIDRFFSNIDYFDHPIVVTAVPPAWMEYQQKRTNNDPHAKFVLYMDPTPIWIGNYAQSDTVAKSAKHRTSPRSDVSNRGRMIGDEIVEFYPEVQTSSVRVDVWLGRKPTREMKTEAVYSGVLKVVSSKLQIWTLGKPMELAISPGKYEIDVVLINRGKCSPVHFLDRERFEREDLERFEIYLNPRL